MQRLGAAVRAGQAFRNGRDVRQNGFGMRGLLPGELSQLAAR